MRQFSPKRDVDPRVFLTAIVTVMMHYPLDVVERICDPFFGLPGRQNFMPTPFDVRKACDELMEPAWRAQERQRRLDQQFRDRDDDDRLARDRLSRPTLREIEDRCAVDGIFLSGWIARNRHLWGTDRRPLGGSLEAAHAILTANLEKYRDVPDAPPSDDPYWQGERTGGE